jgi:hypothetical protein
VFRTRTYSLHIIQKLEKKKAVFHRPGLLRLSRPWVPSGVMDFLRVLARTERVDFGLSCTCFALSSGSNAMPIFRVARWRSAHGVIDWLCTQERWNPEVAIVFCTAARYCRATSGSCHDDARPDNSTLLTGAVRPHPCFVASLFLITPRTSHGSSQVPESLPAVRVFRGPVLFVQGSMHSYFPVGPPRQREGILTCLGWLALLESHGASSHR